MTPSAKAEDQRLAAKVRELASAEAERAKAPREVEFKKLLADGGYFDGWRVQTSGIVLKVVQPTENKPGQRDRWINLVSEPGIEGPVLVCGQDLMLAPPAERARVSVVGTKFGLMLRACTVEVDGAQ